MKKTALFAAMGLLAAFGVAGCSPSAREDLGEAGKNVGQATEKSVEATGQAAENAGEAVTGATREAGQEVKEAGQEAEEGAERVGGAVGSAVKGAAKETRDAAQSAALTPKIKNALIADKSINASTIDVDTSGEKDTVILKGTVRSQAEKTRAAAVAQKALRDANSSFKLKNNLAVAK